MGVGAMVGAGIFALMGEATAIAGNAVYLSFLIAGATLLFLGYSYARLGTCFLSKGGPVEYIFQGFGLGLFSGTFNVLYWFANIIVISMVAKAFGYYAIALFSLPNPSLYTNLLAILIIVFFTFINFLGSKSVGDWKN